MPADITSMTRGELEREVRRLRAIPEQRITIQSLAAVWDDLRHICIHDDNLVLTELVDALLNHGVEVDLAGESKALEQCPCVKVNRTDSCRVCEGSGTAVIPIRLFDRPADGLNEGESK